MPRDVQPAGERPRGAHAEWTAPQPVVPRSRRWKSTAPSRRHEAATASAPSIRKRLLGHHTPIARPTVLHLVRVLLGSLILSTLVAAQIYIIDEPEGPMSKDCVLGIQHLVNEKTGVQATILQYPHAVPLNGGKGVLLGTYVDYGIYGKIIWIFPQSYHYAVRGGGLPNTTKAKVNNQAYAACTPYVMAHMFAIGVHEAYHASWLCDFDEDKTCEELAIDIELASELCAEATRVSDCLDLYDIEPAACPPESISEQFHSKQDLEDYLDGLCDAFDDLRAKVNDPELKQDFLDCACNFDGEWPEGCAAIPEPPPMEGFTDGCEHPDLTDGSWPIAACAACEEEEG